MTKFTYFQETLSFISAVIESTKQFFLSVMEYFATIFDSQDELTLCNCPLVNRIRIFKVKRDLDQL